MFRAFAQILGNSAATAADAEVRRLREIAVQGVVAQWEQFRGMLVHAHWSGREPSIDEYRSKMLRMDTTDADRLPGWGDMAELVVLSNYFRVIVHVFTITPGQSQYICVMPSKAQTAAASAGGSADASSAAPRVLMSGLLAYDLNLHYNAVGYKTAAAHGSPAATLYQFDPQMMNDILFAHADIPQVRHNTRGRSHCQLTVDRRSVIVDSVTDVDTVCVCVVTARTDVCRIASSCRVGLIVRCCICVCCVRIRYRCRCLRCRSGAG